MGRLDALLSLAIELKKVGALGGAMAIVVVPEDHADRAMASKRDVDTAVCLEGYVVVGMFGVEAEGASAAFVSVPKGIAVFPRDGQDIQELFFVALDRLRVLGKVPWAKRLLDVVRDSGASERLTPEERYLEAAFYGFYAFLAAHPDELAGMLRPMAAGEQNWIKDMLPYGQACALEQQDASRLLSPDAFMKSWDYEGKAAARKERGALTLRRFRSVEQLFTLPVISQRIIALLDDPLISAEKMSEVIGKDPVLTSKLLKIVNSAFYGFHRQIDSVEHAVVILGNDEVINLAFSIAVSGMVENLSGSGARKLWEHSMITAHLAQWFGRTLGSGAQVLYTLGLLHDLGKIIFFQSGGTSGTLEECSSLAHLAAEEEENGISHAEMGAYLAERWNLPDTLVDGIMFHHLPGKAANPALVMTVHLADVVAHNGCLEMSQLNYAAVDFLKKQGGAGLSQEAVRAAYADVAARVALLLEV